MARITITIPDSLHDQVLKLSKKEAGSVSYTISKLVELGLLLKKNKSQDKEEHDIPGIDKYCNKLIIQMNEIIKEIAVKNFEFSTEKIAEITMETNKKYNELITV